MELVNTLIIYLVTVVIVTFFLVRLTIRARSAFVIALLMGQVLLNFICPATEIANVTDQGSALAVYYCIQMLSPILLLAHGIRLCWHDRETPRFKQERNF